MTVYSDLAGWDDEPKIPSPEPAFDELLQAIECKWKQAQQ